MSEERLVKESRKTAIRALQCKSLSIVAILSLFFSHNKIISILVALFFYALYHYYNADFNLCLDELDEFMVSEKRIKEKQQVITELNNGEIVCFYENKVACWMLMRDEVLEIYVSGKKSKKINLNNIKVMTIEKSKVDKFIETLMTKCHVFKNGIIFNIKEDKEKAA